MQKASSWLLVFSQRLADGCFSENICNKLKIRRSWDQACTSVLTEFTWCNEWCKWSTSGGRFQSPYTSVNFPTHMCKSLVQVWGVKGRVMDKVKGASQPDWTNPTTSQPHIMPTFHLVFPLLTPFHHTLPLPLIYLLQWAVKQNMWSL